MNNIVAPNTPRSPLKISWAGSGEEKHFRFLPLLQFPGSPEIESPWYPNCDQASAILLIDPEIGIILISIVPLPSRVSRGPAFALMG